MPLKKGRGKKVRNANIGKLISEGRDPKQAVAIAYKQAAESSMEKLSVQIDRLAERFLPERNAAAEGGPGSGRPAGEAADAQSAKANAASADAKDKGGHQKASEEHLIAKNMHQSAAKEAKKAGDKEGQARHESAANTHAAASFSHSEKAHNVDTPGMRQV